MPKPVRQSMAQATGVSHRGGIANLFQDTSATIEQPGTLPLEQIDPNPYQSRQAFNEASLAELAADIVEHGVLQPIGVRQVGDRYVIVYGERRYRAAKLAGLSEIPTRVLDLDEQQARVITVIENLQREDLDIEDEARSYLLLMQELGFSSVRELAAYLHKDHVYIWRRLKLLSHPALMESYRQGTIGLKAAVDEVVKDEQEISLAEAQELASESVSLGNTTSTVVGRGGLDRPGSQGNTAGEVVERDELGGAVSQRTSFAWRPYQASYRRLAQLQPEQVPDEDAPTLLAMLDGIEEETKRLRSALQQRIGRGLSELVTATMTELAHQL